MKCENPEKILEKFPELQDIADRLERSEKLANDLKEKRKNPSSQAGEENQAKKREYVAPGPEHSFISEYRDKKGNWKTTAYTAEPGKEAFVKMLERCMNAYDPDGIKIKIFQRTKSRNGQSFTIYFTEDTEEIKSENPVESLLGKRVDELETKLKEKGNAPGDISNVMLDLKLLQRDTLHAQEKFQMVNAHNKEIEDLQDENSTLKYDLEDANEYIEELEGIVEERTEALGSVHSEYEKKEQKKEENPFVTMLAAVGESALKGFVIKNPELLDGFNLSAEQKQKLISKLKTNEETKEVEGDKNGGASSSDPPTGIDADLKDKTKPHADALKNIWLYLKGLPLEDFKVIYEINMALSTQAGDMDKEIANSILETVREAKQTENTTQE